MDTYLPPKFSLSPFFVRHVAAPKRLRHIEGLNRAPICAVFDDPKQTFAARQHTQRTLFPPNSFNEDLLKTHDLKKNSTSLPLLTKRKERAMPPQGRFQTFGLIDDVDKWRDELNNLALSVGLVTQHDIDNQAKKKERAKLLKSLEQETEQHQQKVLSAKAQSKKPQSSYSSRTSRLNEPLLTGRRSTTRGSMASRALSTANKPNFIVDEQDREAWMLQVLCQILQTDSLVDVQSWLVSSDPNEKEKVQNLINQAMVGLQASGRIIEKQQDDSTSNAKRDAESQVNHHDLDSIQNVIERISMTPQHTLQLKSQLTPPPPPQTTQSNGSALNKLTKVTLETIPEKDTQIMKIEDAQESNQQSSPIKFFPDQNDHNAFIKLEAPTKDHKIEEVNVTMVVKDEKSNVKQNYGGTWKPELSVAKHESNETKA